MINVEAIRSFITRAIEEHFDESVSLDMTISEAFPNADDSKVSELATDIIEAIDIEVLANKIALLIANKSLTYKQETIGLKCEECKRPFGSFISEQGGEVSESIVLSPGESIILALDF